MMAFLKFISIIVILVIGVSYFVLHRNGANLFEPPGVTKRLGVFLSVNSASTSEDPYFEELRTPVFNLNQEELYNLVLNAATESGWGVIANDKDSLNVNFVVSSPMFLFEDDVFVQVSAVGDKQSSLFIKSSSRKGSADFAANSGHIQKLINAVKVLHAQ